MHPMEDASSVEKSILNKSYNRGIPVNGSLELTPLCNMSCEMCYVHLTPSELKKLGRLLTVKEWLSIAQQMKEAGVLFLLLTGGEPLTYPDFKQLYTQLHEMGMILTVNTNGTLIDEEWADFFAKLKPRRINITLYGDQDTYHDCCHYPAGYERVLDAIQLLKKRDVDVRIGGSITKYNEKDLPFLYEIGKQLDLPVRVDTYIMPDIREKNVSTALSTRLTPHAAAKAHLYALERSMGDEVFSQYIQKTVEVIESNRNQDASDRMTCYASNCSFTINWQGNMRPCVILHCPSVSVLEHGFAGAWEELRRQCSQIRIHPDCKTCRLRPLCRTCPASALLETGSYQGLPTYMCEYTEAIYKEIYDRVLMQK